MAVIKEISIKDAAGTGFDTRDIGAEAQYVDISFDASGNIIDDITASGVTVDHTESLPEVLDDLKSNIGDAAPINHATGSDTYGAASTALYGHVKLGTGLEIDSESGATNVKYGTTAGTAVEGNDPRLEAPGEIANDVTFTNAGSGDPAGTSFNGAAPVNVSYNTVGAAPTSHAADDDTYGVASATKFGHVKVGTGIGVSGGTISLANHANATASTYGGGTADAFGHVKLTDTYNNTSPSAATNGAATSTGASAYALQQAFQVLIPRAPEPQDGLVAYNHNSFYRGKNLSSYSNADLHSMVSSGKFDDIYVGDYFERTLGALNVTVKDAANADVTYTRSSGTVRYYVAHLDYMNTTGYDAADSNHYFGANEHNMILIANIGSGKMNNTNITTGAYNSSAMCKFLDNSATISAFQTSLGSSYVKTNWNNWEAESTGTTDSGWSTVFYQRAQTASWGHPHTLRLLTEPQVYGGTVWSTAYDVGIFHTQLAIFRYNPRVMGRVNWWLSSVSSATLFCVVSYAGNASYGYASDAFAVVPQVVFV